MKSIFNPEVAENVLKEYISSGVYSERATCKKNKEEAQSALRSRVVEFGQKRTVYEIDGHSIIAKFVKKEIAEVDHEAMIREILNYIRSEGLSQIITLDSKTFTDDTMDISIVDDYLYKPTYYVKYTPNKFGKSFALDGGEDLYGLSADDLIRRILFYKDANTMLEGYHKNVMKHFDFMEDMSIKTAIGTVSKIKNKAVWDINQIARDFGDEFIIQHGKVKLSKLERLFDMGALPPEMLWENRRVIDHNVEFHVMTYEAEQRALEAFRLKEEMRQARIQQRIAE